MKYPVIHFTMLMKYPVISKDMLMKYPVISKDMFFGVTQIEKFTRIEKKERLKAQKKVDNTWQSTRVALLHFIG